MFAYNEFAYKKPNDHRKLEDRFQKKAIFQFHIRKFADKNTAYNEDHLYVKLTNFRLLVICQNNNIICLVGEIDPRIPL